MLATAPAAAVWPVEQVLAVIGAPEAERRLSPFGIRAADEHALLVATVQDGRGDQRGPLISSPPLAGWYTGMTGLRWSYHEAYEAMTRGPGIHEREQMSLTGLLLAGGDVPLRDLARDTLRPLHEFDAAHVGSLVATLRAYLDADGSVAAVAARLIVHRNTVRYRVEQIERLTGRTLTSTADRVQLWLAMAATRLADDDQPPDSG